MWLPWNGLRAVEWLDVYQLLSYFIPGGAIHRDWLNVTIYTEGSQCHSHL